MGRHLLDDKAVSQIKSRQLYQTKAVGLEGVYNKLPDGRCRRLTRDELEHAGPALGLAGLRAGRPQLAMQRRARSPSASRDAFFPSPISHWKRPSKNVCRASRRTGGRTEVSGNSLRYVRYYGDMPVSPIANIWLDTGIGSFTETEVLN